MKRMNKKGNENNLLQKAESIKKFTAKYDLKKNEKIIIIKS